jgi:drug/metabolite transporter (DMT)-like permease
MNAFQRRMLILFATLMLAVSAILTRYTDASSMGLVFYRMFFSVILTAPLVIFALWRKTLGSIDIKRVGFCMLSGFILALHFFTFFESLRFTSIASNLVFINTSVFFTAGIMFVFFGEKISRKATGAIFVTFGGSVIIAISDIGGSNNEFWGDILAIIGALLFSIYTIIGGKVRSTVTTVMYTFLVYISAAITALVICMGGGGDIMHFTTTDYLCAFGMAFFCTLLGQSLYSWGVKYESPTFIAVIGLGEPVFGALLGLIILGEIPATMVLIGSAVVLAGMYLFSIYTEKDRPESEDSEPA